MGRARPAGEITMLDVFRAVDSLDGGHLFEFHANPNPDCPVGAISTRCWTVSWPMPRRR